MDQKKIGSFLRELRTEKGLTQEQLAERLNVSGRTISRWENGNNMPDLSIIVELADFYSIDIRELLNGERKSDIVNEDLKETLEMVSEYTTAEKENIKKKLSAYTIGSAVCFAILFIIGVFQLERVHTCFQTLSVYGVTLGLIYSVSGAIKLFQLTDKLDKASFKKIKTLFNILAIVLCILLLLLVLFLLGII